MVSIEEARELGFKVPGRSTVAMRGKRTQGHDHEVGEVTEAAPMLPAHESDEDRIERVTSEAETLLSRIKPTVSEPEVAKAEEPSLADVANAFASWGQ
jgi:hypothetical protein